MKRPAVIVIGILLLSLIPWNIKVSGDDVPQSTKAEELLRILHSIENYSQMINCSSDEGKELLNRAEEYYRNGDYNSTIKTAFEAMKEFSKAIQECKNFEEQSSKNVTSNNLLQSAEFELEITKSLLDYTRKLIEKNELPQTQLPDILVLYNRTFNLYIAIKANIANGTINQKDLELLVQNREQLENALNLAIKSTVEIRAREIARIQLEKLAILANSTNSTEILLLKYELSRALKSGDNREILRVLRKVTDELTRMAEQGKWREIPHSVPGKPSFPGSSEEGTPSMPPKPEKSSNESSLDGKR